MKKSYLIIAVVAILIAILGCVFLDYLVSENPQQPTTTIEFYLINAKIPQLLKVGDELQVGVYFCK